VLIMDMFGPIAECKFVEMNQQVWIHISQWNILQQILLLFVVYRVMDESAWSYELQFLAAHH
jgi:hypothetical protein